MFVKTNSLYILFIDIYFSSALKIYCVSHHSRAHPGSSARGINKQHLNIALMNAAKTNYPSISILCNL